jgi:integrase
VIQPRSISTAQLPLFDSSTAKRGTPPSSEAQSEALLVEFRSARLRAGAHPQSVRREVSQLRSIAREARHFVRGLTMATLVVDLATAARALCEPRTRISRSTGRTRLIAFQRFLGIVGPTLGRDPIADLDVLDELLPSRGPTTWRSSGTVVAGTAERRRRRGPALNVEDLNRIIEAVGSTGNPERNCRDRALVALLCFSGLRPLEVVRLRWEQLTTDLVRTGHYGPTFRVERNGEGVKLPILGPAACLVEQLAGLTSGKTASLSGPIFPAASGSVRPLSYRTARQILLRACVKAGLPPLESAELRAAYAHWLRVRGLSDNEVASVLGLARVRTVDRLISRHAALNAQRQVREVLEL